jgi:hypothetical protein
MAVQFLHGEFVRSTVAQNGGPGGIRTPDQGIMRPTTDPHSKQLQENGKAESGRVRQNPQPRRNQEGGDA